MIHSTIKIAFFDTKPYDRLFFETVNKEARFGFDIQFYETRLTPASARIAEGAKVVCAFVNDNLCAETIRILHELGVELIAMRCAGYNNVNLAEAYGKLRVVRVPEYSPHAVAEYTIGLLLTLNRNLHRAYCRVRENNFSINGFIGFDLFGKTIGIVGTGKIGRTFAELLQGFGMKILAYDLYPNETEAERLNMEYVPLEELFRRSDVISLHCPLTPENRHMINKESIAMMKPGVFILNTSRGALIDAAALIKGLKKKQIGGAGLDVYEEETDYFFEDRSDAAIDDDVLARLMTFPNVLVTSHQAFFTKEAVGNIARITLDNILDYFYKRPLANEICQKCDGKRSCPGKANGTVCRHSNHE